VRVGEEAIGEGAGGHDLLAEPFGQLVQPVGLLLAEPLPRCLGEPVGGVLELLAQCVALVGECAGAKRM